MACSRNLWTLCPVLIMAVVVMLVSATDAYACQRASPVSNVEMVSKPTRSYASRPWSTPDRHEPEYADYGAAGLDDPFQSA